MLKQSRGPSIDTQQVVANSGHNKFDAIIIAANRARELISKERDSTGSSSTVTALLEIQAGEIGREYFGRLKK